MTLFEMFTIAFGLAMDAFTVSMCKGLSMKNISIKKALIIAFYFGAFQAIMPAIGYFLGNAFSSFLQEIDHWIAFVLLGLIGAKMIKDSFSGEDEITDCVKFPTMVVLAIATSIDAFAVGVTFAFFELDLWVAISIIGAVTFALSFLGVVIGHKFGNKFQGKPELLGGIVLILLGLKILLEHLGVI